MHVFSGEKEIPECTATMHNKKNCILLINHLTPKSMEKMF